MGVTLFPPSRRGRSCTVPSETTRPDPKPATPQSPLEHQPGESLLLLGPVEHSPRLPILGIRLHIALAPQ